MGKKQQKNVTLNKIEEETGEAKDRKQSEIFF